MDVSRYDPDSQKALHLGLQLARRYGHGYLEAEHVAYSLLKLGLVRLPGFKTTEALDVIQSHLEKSPKIYGLRKISFGKRLDRALDLVEERYTSRIVDPKGLWEEVVKQSSLLQILSQNQGLAVPISGGDDIDPAASVPKPKPNDIPNPLPPKARPQGKAPAPAKKLKKIESFTIDLTDAAARGNLQPVHGREKELHRVLQILGRHKKNNPLLIGEPGVGKSALAEGLAWQLLHGKTSEVLKDMRVLSLDLGALLAGTKYRGEFEDRMQQLLEVASEDPGRYIFFIDEIHMIMGAGNQEGGADLANLLKPALASGTFRCLGATTTAEYKHSIQTDAALARRFQTVLIDEPSPEQTLKILNGIKSIYEDHHKVRISDEALLAAVQMSIRYLPGQKLPDKAIDLVDEAASAENLRLGTLVTVDSVSKVIQERLHLTPEQWSRPDKQIYLHLEKRLAKQVFGQWGALKRLAQAIRRAKSGVSNPSHPWGSFLFLGPQGVGKKQTAQALAHDLFGDPKKLIAIDLSEYSQPSSIYKLIGAPPGLAGHEEGGYLADAILHQPFSVVYFDHVDQAHPQVLGILLQIVESGRILDWRGRIADFSNALIIFAVTIQASHLEHWSDSGSTLTWEQVLQWSEANDDLSMRQKLSLILNKPELAQKLDEIIVFRKLSPVHLTRILGGIVDALNKRLQSQKIRLRLGPELINYLVSNARKSGPAALQRVFALSVLNPLSEKILLDPKLVHGSWLVELRPEGLEWQPDYVANTYLAS